MVLGLVIEEVTGRGYMEYIHEAIFTGLGAERKDVIQGRTLLEDQDPREPWYDNNGIHGRNVFDVDGPTVPVPYGGWHLELHISSGGMVTSARPLGPS